MKLIHVGKQLEYHARRAFNLKVAGECNHETDRTDAMAIMLGRELPDSPPGGYIPSGD